MTLNILHVYVHPILFCSQAISFIPLVPFSPFQLSLKQISLTFRALGIVPGALRLDARHLFCSLVILVV